MRRPRLQHSAASRPASARVRELFESILRTVELVDNTIPAVLAGHLRFTDVVNLAPDLHIPAEASEGFAEVWEQIRHSPVLGNPAKTAGLARPLSSPTNWGTEQRLQPEGSADYTSQVVEYIRENGSIAALQGVIRSWWSIGRQIHTVATSTVMFAVGALESSVAEIERIRLRTYPEAMRGVDKEFALADLIELGDIEAVIERAIDTRVESLCYGRQTR